MTKSQLGQLSRRERQIMDALIENRELSAQEVQAAIPDAPSYSAVRALLTRLVEKGAISYRQEGARYHYFSLISDENARASALSRLIKIFFRGSRGKAVNALLDLEGEGLSEQEIADIERSIARLKIRASSETVASAKDKREA